MLRLVIQKGKVSANLIILYKPQKNINASHTGDMADGTLVENKVLTFHTSTTVKRQGCINLRKPQPSMK
jgi:hypothetical protein